MATFLFRVVSSILEPPCFNKNASLRLFQAFLVQTSLRMIKYLYLIWTSYTLLTSSVYHICNISSSLLLFGRRRSNKITWTSFAWHCRDIYMYICPRKTLEVIRCTGVMLNLLGKVVFPKPPIPQIEITTLFWRFYPSYLLLFASSVLTKHKGNCLYSFLTIFYFIL